ncbi:MAG TPA: glutamate synthase subunit beta [Propionibacterium sp.]|nr:glutamate synthase subunit beta [Propionibacterium sp.]
MADPRGFMTHPREVAQRRDPAERVKDWREVYPGSPGRAVLPIIRQQASRCMDCGIPFCHTGCPLGNLIPEWNDLIHRDLWREATDRLHATNNFPEFTGRLCPAPCETACVVGINRAPVTIKNVEVAIADKAWDDRRVIPVVPEWHTGKTVAVVGSGPAGLAAAQQLTRSGHTVVVYERDDDIGGLLRFGIPEFKMEKKVLNRRLKQMRQEGTVFTPNTTIGVDITGEQLLDRFDAVVLAIGSTVAREVPVPGRDLAGIHLAMEYLTQANREALGKKVVGQITAAGKHVLVVGGGDTGSDCIGTAVRQGAASVTQLIIRPQAPTTRPGHEPWPTHPVLFELSSSHEEGEIGQVYSVSTGGFHGSDGHVTGLQVTEAVKVDGVYQRIEGTVRDFPADLVLLAIGYAGPEPDGVVAELGVELDARGNIARGADFETNVPGVFVAGDAGRGQSLVVWAIAEGRSAAHGVDAFLQGSSALPKPIQPTDRPLVV